MTTRVLTKQDVEQLLPMEASIRAAEQAFLYGSSPGTVNPLRHGMRFEDRPGLLGLMPAYIPDRRRAGIKVVTFMPQNHGTDLDSHQGVILLFEAERGRLLGVVDASSVTAIRTAAASAAATKLLAKKDAGVLCLLGAGIQAETHLEAIRLVRSLRSVRVFSPQSADIFAASASAQWDIPVEVCASPAQAVTEADIICTVTSSSTPVLEAEWIRPGCHINAVGACFREARELDSRTVIKSKVYVDRLESAMNEAGDILIPLSEGLITKDHVRGEIGQVLVGAVPGREADSEVTLFKSLGFAVEDLTAAEFVLDEGARHNLGVTLEMGGERS